MDLHKYDESSVMLTNYQINIHLFIAKCCVMQGSLNCLFWARFEDEFMNILETSKYFICKSKVLFVSTSERVFLRSVFLHSDWFGDMTSYHLNINIVYEPNEVRGRTSPLEKLHVFSIETIVIILVNWIDSATQ